MLNEVPYNVTVPEYQPARKAPIFPQITRKYPCQENVVGVDNAFRSLTWKIQQPDQTMVWTSVKLVLPLSMKAKDCDGNYLDMRVTSQLPCCNIALAESPMGAFRQSSLTLNGRIFSEVNDYRRTLDACYQGTGPSSYGDNHSLKPIVSRDVKMAAALQDIHLVTIDPGTGAVVTTDPTHVIRTEHINRRVLDSAFSLLEHNGPFLERARAFQDNLSADGKSWEGLLTSYLELGPFQARARKGNTAVPYIRDMHLLLNWAVNPSNFDNKVGVSVAAGVTNRALQRSLPCKLFEFATIPNIRHLGETVLSSGGDGKFISSFDCSFTSKPFLEVTFTKYLESLKPVYKLRCFERQYEKSNPFQLEPHTQKDATGKIQSIWSDKKLARVTSKLLSYPTKVYLYAELVDTDKNSFIAGGVRRSCLLNNIHCRINQRPDVIFNPSQEACFELFQRHTNSSLEYASWLKSPIYCWTPVDLGQSDMFANDARVALIEWDAECQLTKLQLQETNDSYNGKFLQASGYSMVQTEAPDLLIDNTDIFVSFDPRAGHAWLGAGDTDITFLLQDKNRTAVDEYLHVDIENTEPLNNKALRLAKFYVSPTGAKLAVTYAGLFPVTQFEGFLCHKPKSQLCSFKGFLFAMVATKNVALSGGHTVNKGFFFGFTPGTSHVFYSEQSHYFDMNDTEPDRLQCINPWSAVTVTEVGVDAKGDKTYNYYCDVDNMNLFRGTINENGKASDGDWMNPTVGNQTDGMKLTGLAPYAYVCDRAGVRTTDVQGTATYDYPGPIKEHTNGYIAADQTSGDFVWVMFAPSDDMVNRTGVDKDFLQFRSVPDAAKQNFKDSRFMMDNEGANYCDIFGHGRQDVSIACPVRRNYVFPADQGNKTLQYTITDPKDTTASWQFDCLEGVAENQTTERFQYELKALYEYGNAQYEFTSDGLPTKVLPNLVPVAPSSIIPQLQ